MSDPQGVELVEEFRVVIFHCAYVEKATRTSNHNAYTVGPHQRQEFPNG